MWFFKKNKKEDLRADLSWLGTDMHSHLVPGIDDGAPDMATSLELVRGLALRGYRKLITTPHILWEIYPTTSEIIVQGAEELKAAIREEGLDIELHAAAEYYLDEHFLDLL